MQRLDPHSNFPSLLQMPRLFVDLHSAEVNYKTMTARIIKQKAVHEVLQSVVRYLENLLDSGLYMCRLTPEWQAVHALLAHRRPGVQGGAAAHAPAQGGAPDKVRALPVLSTRVTRPGPQ